MGEIDATTDREYDCRGQVPESHLIIPDWKVQAARYREENPPLVVPYGTRDRETMDVFGSIEHNKPVVLFIHGGYWKALDKSFFSHLAAGLNALGITVAIMSYDLCSEATPEVTIATIVEQTRNACRTIANTTGSKVIVVGHSAGGHMAACLLATEDTIPAAYSISGIFDLRNLLRTELNRVLRLHEDMAYDLSPLLWTPQRGKTLVAAVGGRESDAFVMESEEIVERWGRQGVTTELVIIPGTHHFTVINGLRDRASAMCQRIKAMVDAA